MLSSNSLSLVVVTKQRTSRTNLVRCNRFHNDQAYASVVYSKAPACIDTGRWIRNAVRCCALIAVRVAGRNTVLQFVLLYICLFRNDAGKIQSVYTANGIQHTSVCFSCCCSCCSCSWYMIRTITIQFNSIQSNPFVLWCIIPITAIQSNPIKSNQIGR